ncbi:MAG: excinuclease ABC subunit UvrA [Bacteroidales bacterium]|nr:excinuclease ABC subunit UvrA [Bacteroidales bacterium]
MTDSNKKYIDVHHARVNNLKNIDVQIPLGKLVVITGVSGSGKSSLAFDTLYAEGQRRYVESLNSYARQFLGRNNKPEVDYIHGIPPAIAIEQKVNTRNPRSTVGTSTEVYDYLKILFSRIGRTFSPVSGVEVKRHTVTDVVDAITSLPEGTKAMILAPLKNPDYESLVSQGFTRIDIKGETINISPDNIPSVSDEVNLIIDRVVANREADTVTRLSDSVSTAFYEGKGYCILRVFNPDRSFSESVFSNKFEADGMTFEPPSEQLFTFNSPVGACPRCEGFGKIVDIDPDLVIRDPNLSVAEGCVSPWSGVKLGEWKTEFMRRVPYKQFDVYTPYKDLTKAQRDLLWHGAPGLYGIDDFFQMVKENQYKIQYRVLLARYRGKTTCPACNGTRLRPEAEYVKINGKSITDLVEMSLENLQQWLHELSLSDYEARVAQRLLKEIRQRVDVLCNVGLEYLTLNRLSNSLSGGESQRINIATSIGSSLVGSLYILDEPSIGLHSADTERLIKVLRQLQQLGNTVVVVEHDEDIIKAADQVIDIGPEAGRLGGEVVFMGSVEEMAKADTLTTKYISGQMEISVPKSRRAWNKCITLTRLNENNLQNIDAKFPLNCLTVVTGVSGSGKSTLVTRILYPALKAALGEGVEEHAGKMGELSGSLNSIFAVEFIDQNPIGKSTRSNPATYIKAYDEIRKLMCAQQLSKQNGYTTAHFSFNAKGGRCETCQGEGKVHIEMQFMADVVLECEACHGRRFKDEILDVKYRDKNISDILDMTINQAVEFFSEQMGPAEQRIVKRLLPLQEVGLGYVKMGQSSSTLSGGESQRVKLAAFIAEERMKPTLFIFDEPTTGLHFHDINKLMKAFNRLIEAGHSIVVIEHNMDVIKCADYIIDMGPGAGVHGGKIVACGTPEQIVACPDSVTGKFLKEKLK